MFYILERVLETFSTSAINITSFRQKSHAMGSQEIIDLGDMDAFAQVGEGVIS